MQSTIARSLLLISVLAVASYGQSSATLFGRIFDPDGAVVPAATITMANRATGEEWRTHTDDQGNYQIAALPARIYRIEVSAAGFQTHTVESASIEVGRTLAQDFRVRVATASEQVTVTADPFMIERATSTVGQAINQRTVEEIPLNGRYFLDLTLLVPGSVTPSPTGFSTMPSRGLGALAINNAGNREETANFLINGITLNNQAFNSISFQPSISSVQEFKIDNSTISVEYGQDSGSDQCVAGWQLSAIVQAQSGSPINIVTNNSVVNGTANTLRPDVTGPIHVISSVDRWFDTSVFVPVERLGNLGRNMVIGPRFNDTDLSVTKNIMLGERTRIQFRTELFDLFNHANFGQPGNIVGSPNFGRVTSTRFPTGEFGSSRQIQFAIKMLF